MDAGERVNGLSQSILAWHSGLDEAHTIEAVVAVVRDYLAQWSPVDLARLPARCRPGRIVDGADITEHAFTLVCEQCASQGRSDARLSQMAAFFASASRRVARLAAPRGHAGGATSRAATGR